MAEPSTSVRSVLSVAGRTFTCGHITSPSSRDRLSCSQTGSINARIAFVVSRPDSRLSRGSICDRVLQNVRHSEHSGDSVCQRRVESADRTGCVRLFLPNRTKRPGIRVFTASIRLDSCEPAPLSPCRSTPPTCGDSCFRQLSCWRSQDTDGITRTSAPTETSTAESTHRQTLPLSNSIPADDVT